MTKEVDSRPLLRVLWIRVHWWSWTLWISLSSEFIFFLIASFSCLLFSSFYSFPLYFFFVYLLLLLILNASLVFLYFFLIFPLIFSLFNFFYSSSYFNFSTFPIPIYSFLSFFFFPLISSLSVSPVISPLLPFISLLYFIPFIFFFSSLYFHLIFSSCSSYSYYLSYFI